MGEDDGDVEVADVRVVVWCYTAVVWEGETTGLISSSGLDVMRRITH